jgi:dUTP pyrophosphatase
MIENELFPMVGVVLLYEGAKIPERMTEKSACYDVFAYIQECVGVIKIYDGWDNMTQTRVTGDSIIIPPFGRALIPTGCKFKIPDGYSIRIHPRSGNALKRHLTLPNCEGVIDCDYPEQTYALIANNTFIPKSIAHLERVCQLELVPVVEFQFKELPEDFGQMTDRKSGLGSTGEK